MCLCLQWRVQIICLHTKDKRYISYFSQSMICICEQANLELSYYLYISRKKHAYVDLTCAYTFYPWTLVHHINCAPQCGDPRYPTYRHIIIVINKDCTLIHKIVTSIESLQHLKLHFHGLYVAPMRYSRCCFQSPCIRYNLHVQSRDSLM